MRLAPFAMLVLAVGAGAADPPTDRTVAATVNGEVIRLDEVDARLRRRPIVDAPLTAEQARRLRLLILDEIIDERLLAQFLREHGPELAPGELDRHVAALAEALRRQGKTLAGFARELGLSEPQLREAFAARLRFQRSVEARATDEELRKYHAEYRDHFDRVAVKLSVIVARVSPDAPPGEWAAARMRLASLRADILAGKLDFAEAARKFSVDPTAPDGGEVGYIARKDTVVEDALCRAAFALKVGEVSEPVDGEFGVYLLRVSDRKAGTSSPFDRVAEEVRDCYTEDVRRQLVGRLRKAASIQVNVP